MEIDFKFAYTPADGYKSYPPFINIQADEKEVQIIVQGHERPHPMNPEEWLDTGEQVSIKLPIEMLYQLRSALIDLWW